MYLETCQHQLGTILKLDHHRTRVYIWSSFDQFFHPEYIMVVHGLGEGQLHREDGWDANFVCFDIHIGGND